MIAETQMAETAPTHIVIDSGLWRGLTVEVVSISAPGRRRHANSDARLSVATRGLFAVADGVSTMPGSAGAAQRCLEYLSGELRAASNRDAETLSRIVRHVSGRIFAEGRARRSGLEAGACTLDGIALDADAITVFHVGDGGVWLGGPGEMRLATTAQNAFEASARNPERNALRLAAAIGARPVVDPWVARAPLTAPGAALIATDGVEDPEALTQAPWFQHRDDANGFAATLEAIAATDHSDDMTLVAARWRPGA